ncbi:MAG: extracellular solute-binding protein [Chloroflexi bacterium]|nr:extracellular solute-binding protein [Chloroflexota bacterium]
MGKSSTSPTYALLIVALVSILSGCAAREPAQLTAPAIEPQIKTGAPAMPAWQEEWEQVVREAKKEGRVAMYVSFSNAVRAAITEAFSQEYGIDLDITVGRGAELSPKVTREKRAGLNLVDLIITGQATTINSLKPAGVLTPIEPLLLLPDLKDAQVWWEGKPPFVDSNGKDNQYLTFIYTVEAPITINTDMVKTEEITSMRDVLNPKWKGKITIMNPFEIGGGLTWFANWGERLLDYDFMRSLAKMEPVIMADRVLQVEWVARGKNPIALAAIKDAVEQYKAQGAPLAQIVPKEGAILSVSSGVISAVTEAPHPNAAKLFLNWFLSREGQAIYVRAAGYQSARLDVPTDHLPASMVRQPGVKYLTEDEDWLMSVPEKQKIAREIFGPLMK